MFVGDACAGQPSMRLCKCMLPSGQHKVACAGHYECTSVHAYTQLASTEPHVLAVHGTPLYVLTSSWTAQNHVLASTQCPSCFCISPRPDLRSLPSIYLMQA
eukprot:1156437-Pelagomonas_calceolata.AAC.10